MANFVYGRHPAWYRTGQCDAERSGSEKNAEQEQMTTNYLDQNLLEDEKILLFSGCVSVLTKRSMTMHRN